MRMRPARLHSPIRPSTIQWMGGAVALLFSLAAAGPSAAAWEGSTAERIVTTGLDLAIVRPLAVVRTGVGWALLVPAAILASPACLVNLASGEECGPVYSTPYDILVGEPAEYAFSRKLGEALI